MTVKRKLKPSEVKQSSTKNLLGGSEVSVMRRPITESHIQGADQSGLYSADQILINDSWDSGSVQYLVFRVKQKIDNSLFHCSSFNVFLYGAPTVT